MAAPVQLYIYDLTRGLAAQLSPMLLGQQIDGVWHTAIVVHGVEWFFGYGVQRAQPGSTPFGQPLRVVTLGHTEVDGGMVRELVEDLKPRFQVGPASFTGGKVVLHERALAPAHDTPLVCAVMVNIHSALDLLHTIATNRPARRLRGGPRACLRCLPPRERSNELSQLLVGEGIPEYILLQAQAVLDTPLGAMLMPTIMAMEGLTANATATGFQGGPGSAAAFPGSEPAATAAAARPTPPAAAQPARSAAAAAVAQGTAAGATAPAAAAAAEPPPSAPAPMYFAASPQQAAEPLTPSATGHGAAAPAATPEGAAMASAGAARSPRQAAAMAAEQRALQAAAERLCLGAGGRGVPNGTTDSGADVGAGKLANGLRGGLPITADSTAKSTAEPS